MKYIFYSILFILGTVFCPLSGEEQNALIVTENGLEMFHWDLQFVRQAKHSIEISAVFLGGAIAQELLTEIEKRIEQVPQLQVYILTTPILLEKEDWALIEKIQSKYPHNFHLEHATTIAIIWPDVSGIDNHIKMFIVDEKYFSTGGTNLDITQCTEGTTTPPRNTNKPSVISNNLPAGMRDQDVVGKGPLAKEMRKTFYKFFSLWEHYNKTGRLERNPEKFAENRHYTPVNAQAEVAEFENSPKKRFLNKGQIKLVVSGAHQEQNAITQEYVKLINGAKQEIIIANLYFSPVDPIFNALIEAVNRGVRLRVVTNGVSDVAPEYTKFFCWANRLSYVPVLYGANFHFWDAWSVEKMKIKDTRIFEYYVKDILLHKKMMVVDGKKGILGSYNLGRRSDMGDYEMVVSIDSEEVVRDLKLVHERDLKFSREITPKEACEWYFNPVTAYLGEMQKRFHGLL